MAISKQSKEIYKQINSSNLEFYTYTVITLSIIWGCIGMVGYAFWKFLFSPLLSSAFHNISFADIIEMTESFLSFTL